METTETKAPAWVDDLRVPDDYGRLDEVMSNYGHTIDEAVAVELRHTENYSQYSGWDFCGYVWWDRTVDGGRWACEVWVYKAYCETAVAPNIQDIMDLVSERYGDA